MPHPVVSQRTVEMGSWARNTLLEAGEHPACLEPCTEGNAKLEVNVVFTTDHGTLAALKTASSLARHLHARIRFLIPLLVPYPLPLHHPPVSVAFTAQCCSRMALACAEVSEVHVEIYLCRDKRAVLLRALRAHSVVVVGGRKRWWPSSAQKLARMLQLHGHRAIFVDQSGIPAG